MKCQTVKEFLQWLDENAELLKEAKSEQLICVQNEKMTLIFRPIDIYKFDANSIRIFMHFNNGIKIYIDRKTGEIVQKSFE